MHVMGKIAATRYKVRCSRAWPTPGTWTMMFGRAQMRSSPSSWGLGYALIERGPGLLDEGFKG